MNRIAHLLARAVILGSLAGEKCKRHSKMRHLRCSLGSYPALLRRRVVSILSRELNSLWHLMYVVDNLKLAVL